MNQKRSNGITKLPSGRYQIDFRDANRKRHRESFDTMKEAREKLDEKRTAVRNREYVAPAKIPTLEQAARAWLDGKKISESRHGGPIKESSIQFGRTISTVLSCLLWAPTDWIVWIRPWSKSSAMYGRG
jgi:hypothetical protein